MNFMNIKYAITVVQCQLLFTNYMHIIAGIGN